MFMQATQRFEYLSEQLTTLLVQSEEYTNTHKMQFLKAEQHLKNQVTIQNFLYTRLDQQYANANPSEEEELWTQELIHLCKVCDGEVTKSNKTLESSHADLLSAYALQKFIRLRVHELSTEHYQYIDEFGKVLESTSFRTTADSTTAIQETTADSSDIKTDVILPNRLSSLVSTIS